MAHRSFHRRSWRSTARALALAACLSGDACRRDEAAGAAPTTPAAERAAGDSAPERAATRPPGYVVDSAIDPAEALRRFRVGLGAAPRELAGGASSRDALVELFVRSLARSDTAALRAAAITRAEFAYLIYPGSIYTRPPYQQAPDVVWLQLQRPSDQGLTRLLDRVAGRPLRTDGHRCATSPERHADYALWRDCVVRVVTETGVVREQRLFGVIVERHGRFKFASYANRL